MGRRNRILNRKRSFRGINDNSHDDGDKSHASSDDEHIHISRWELKRTNTSARKFELKSRSMGSGKREDDWRNYIDDLVYEREPLSDEEYIFSFGTFPMDETHSDGLYRAPAESRESILCSTSNSQPTDASTTTLVCSICLEDLDFEVEWSSSVTTRSTDRCIEEWGKERKVCPLSVWLHLSSLVCPLCMAIFE